VPLGVGGGVPVDDAVPLPEGVALPETVPDAVGVPDSDPVADADAPSVTEPEGVPVLLAVCEGVAEGVANFVAWYRDSNLKRPDPDADCKKGLCLIPKPQV
jgi:hypothetical protein